MSNKLLVKYLDPSTGKYEYASVVDIGDLDNLKTQVKTDLVSAINSITLSGEVPENIKSQIDGINSQITDLGKAGLTDRQLAEIQIKLDANIEDIMNQVNGTAQPTRERGKITNSDKILKILSSI